MKVSEKRTIAIDAAIILLFSFLLVATVTVVSAEGDGIFTSAELSYELIGDENIVHVTKEVTFTNVDESTRYWQGYYDTYNYYIPGNAVDIRAYDSSGSMEYTKGDGEFYIFIFNERVWHKEVYTFIVEYDMPVNQNTAVFKIWDNSDVATAKVIIPNEYELNTNKQDCVTTHLDDSYVLDPGILGKNVASITIDLVRHTELNSMVETVALKEKDVLVTVKYWDGEEQWAEHVMDTTSKSLVMIEDIWGIAYPAGYDITIIEGSMEDTGGYGGLNNWSNGILLLHTSRDITLIHELVHYWTESCSFEQLWMDEGYANFYALMVLEKLDPVQATKELDRLSEIEEPEKNEGTLTDWSVPSELVSGYAYQTKLNYKKAFILTYSLYKEVGMDTFKDANIEFINMGYVGNNDHINIMEGISGKELDAIYDQYL
ncbi:hypothetical protein HNV12_04505 [Methanococcoides sp. SA1]|nr:hypothetical protein [Methanococcoides sp. SA1]